MNTKKITALALAALMAAGSTATSFADNYVANAGNDLDAKRPLTFNDDVIYEENDGVLKPSDDFRPGDTLYIRLDELNSNGDKKIEDEKDDMKVYADWKVGKDAVKSIDIIYKKGNYNSSMAETTYTFTVDGVEFKIEGKDIQNDLTSAIKKELTDYQKKHPDFLKKEIADELAKYEAPLYVVSGTYYADAEKALAKAGWKKVAVQIGDGAPTTKGYSSVGELIKKNGTVADGSQYATNADLAVGYGAYDTSSGAGKSALDTSNDYVFSATNKFLSVDMNLTVADVKASGAINGVVDLNGAAYYVKNEGDLPKSVEEAVKADSSIKTVDGYVVGGVMTQPEDAKAMAAGSVIAQEIVEVSGSVDRIYKDNYTYWVEIKTKEDDTTKVLDLAGVLRIGSTKNKAEDAKNQFQLDTSLDNRVYDSNDKYVVVDDEWTFKPDSRSVVKFDKDAEDVVLYFGENEAAWYEFDARGQDALNLEFTFDFNKEIADLFPKANIDFLTFTSNPATNRTGDLYITADEDTFLYEVTEDGVKEIQGAKYNEEEGAWHIRTRKLGAYAISDIELDTSVKVEGKDEASSNSSTSSKPNGDKHNPDTGR